MEALHGSFRVTKSAQYVRGAAPQWLWNDLGTARPVVALSNSSVASVFYLLATQIVTDSDHARLRCRWMGSGRQLLLELKLRSGGQVEPAKELVLGKTPQAGPRRS
jgi:hypothetical protein